MLRQEITFGSVSSSECQTMMGNSRCRLPIAAFTENLLITIVQRNGKRFMHKTSSTSLKTSGSFGDRDHSLHSKNMRTKLHTSIFLNRIRSTGVLQNIRGQSHAARAWCVRVCVLVRIMTDDTRYKQTKVFDYFSLVRRQPLECIFL
jgi:hypothetical protein